MGKIRVKTLGEEASEKKQQEEAEKRRAAKRQKKADVSVQAEVVQTQTQTQPQPEAETEKKVKKTARPTKSQKNIRTRGKKYLQAKKLVEKNKKYKLDEAVALMKKIGYVSFDETVEIHLNLIETNVKGEVFFPYGTGKEVRAVVADDALLAKIDEGVMDFDILIATPAFMPKLVKYARVLGPKGLMPNPKNGTVVEDTKKAIAKFKSGAVRFKSESKFPLLHIGVGKASFPEKNLIENIQVLLAAVKKKNISRAFLSATMGPSVEIEYGE